MKYFNFVLALVLLCSLALAAPDLTVKNFQVTQSDDAPYTLVDMSFDIVNEGDTPITTNFPVQVWSDLHPRRGWFSLIDQEEPQETYVAFDSKMHRRIAPVQDYERKMEDGTQIIKGIELLPGEGVHFSTLGDTSFRVMGQGDTVFGLALDPNSVDLDANRENNEFTQTIKLEALNVITGPFKNEEWGLVLKENQYYIFYGGVGECYNLPGDHPACLVNSGKFAATVSLDGQNIDFGFFAKVFKMSKSININGKDWKIVVYSNGVKFEE